MSYLIRESGQGDKDLIHSFNKKLENNGFSFKLPLPENKGFSSEDLIFERKFILTENENIVRAGYTLKSQWFKINNNLQQIGYYYNPVTAGLFNKKYNICGILLINDAQKKSPNLFCLGMGGFSEALPKLLKGLNWNLQKIPFFFKIYHPNNFLKNIQFLKNNTFKSIIIITLTNSGLGWLFIKLIFAFKSIFCFSFKKKHSVSEQEIKISDNDIERIWEKTKKNNSFIAVRNSKYLEILYYEKKFIKLKFFHNSEVVGWSVSLCTNLQGHKQFGNMRLGSIVDCLSVKGYEISIIEKTAEILRKKNVDLIISNQSHIYWKKALKMNSFINGPSNFIFATSQELSKKLESNMNLKDHMHLTRGDGDGPINL